MKNKETGFVKLIREICEEEEIRIRSYASDWAFSLEKGKKKSYIVGYDFSLNQAAIKDICGDKAIAYELLNENLVPAVEHSFLPNQELAWYVDTVDNEKQVEEAIQKYGAVVLKDNRGTGGNLVFKLSDMKEYQKIAAEIFKHSNSMALSPFYEIIEEYRVVLLNREAKLFIRKERAHVFDENGNKVYLNWKHNLGLGATGIIVEDAELQKRLETLALKALDAIPASFVSVDIIETQNGLKVLEMNGGVMLENFQGQSPECRRIAKEIYRAAILQSLK